jgi:hypothetical protein
MCESWDKDPDPNPVLDRHQMESRIRIDINMMPIHNTGTERTLDFPNYMSIRRMLNPDYQPHTHYPAAGNVCKYICNHSEP